VAILVARNANEAMMASIVGFDEFGVRRSVFVGAFGRNLALVAVKNISHLI
jgi:hypothetical protein